MTWGDSRGTGGAAEQPYPSLPGQAVCRQLPVCPNTLAGDAFHPFSIPFPSLFHVPGGLSRPGAVAGVSARAAVPRDEHPPPGRAGEAEPGSPPGLTKLLHSPGAGNIPKCLPGFSSITGRARSSLGSRPSRPFGCPKATGVPQCRGLPGCSAQGPRHKLSCDPMGTDLVSSTSAGSADLHFSPSAGPRLGERRAETLNRFVLICFMILLGAVFTQIRQASGLDNLLEISGV